jgi:glycosyltransferase involved in cell wall biosynthesis
LANRVGAAEFSTVSASFIQILPNAALIGLSKKMTPLVSVGIPTFNRPEGLAATLANIRAQTYGNLEIIISDNASADPRVAEIASMAAASDSRVSYFRESWNRGAKANFESVLKKSSGVFFMWAADDDAWCDEFIERCVRVHLTSKRPLSVVAMEVAYVSEEGPYPAFSQGQYFYREVGNASPFERIKRAFLGNYDNIVYGVLRREALIGQDGEKPITEFIGPSSNEIGFILQLAQRGDFRVIPEVGFYKRARRQTCDQARWEHVGGFLPLEGHLKSHIRSIPSLAGYHRRVQIEINAAVRLLNISEHEKAKLRMLIRILLWKHFLQLVVRLKGRNSPEGWFNAMQLGREQ